MQSQRSFFFLLGLLGLGEGLVCISLLQEQSYCMVGLVISVSDKNIYEKF